MKNFLCLILASAFSMALAQTGYEKLFEADGSLKLVRVRGDSLLASMGWGPALTLINGTGDIVRTDHVFATELYVPLSISKYAPNAYYFIGNRHIGECDSEWRLDPVIGKMDSSGTVVALKGYEPASFCPDFLSDMVVTHDGGVIAWGRSSFFAIKVDSTLNEVWTRHFNGSGSLRFIRELPGGDFLAGINMDTAGAVVARVNSNGAVLWCRSYIRPVGMVHDCFIESDSSYFVVGVTDVVPSANQQLYLMKLDGTGEPQWCKGFSSAQHWQSSSPSRIVKTVSGDFAMLACSGDNPILMKIDQNGDTLWTRSSGSPGYSFETVDLSTSIEGGLVFSGVILGELPGMNTGMAYLFKTDTIGHLPCLDVAPPPIEVSNLFPLDSSFVLSYFEDTTVVYSISITNPEYPTIMEFDACVITMVTDAKTGSKVSIAPNPNTGHFTVRFKDPLMAESYYSVFDTMGKLLYQRPLAMGKLTEEVDLSRFAKGTYAIKFTDPSGVCFERVVVE